MDKKMLLPISPQKRKAVLEALVQELTPEQQKKAESENDRLYRRLWGEDVPEPEDER